MTKKRNYYSRKRNVEKNSKTSRTIRATVQLLRIYGRSRELLRRGRNKRPMRPDGMLVESF